MSERSLAFQGLRLLFIIDIVCGHAGHPLLGGGGAECSFFFVLSGFLYRDKKGGGKYKDYYLRKIKTIYPVYWLCFALFVLCFIAKGTVYKMYLGWDIIPHIFLVQSWIPVTDAWFFKYLGPSWFLSSLLFCYLVSPFLFKFFNTFKNKKLLLGVTVVLLMMILFVPENPYISWLTYASPIVRTLEYAIGMLLFMVIGQNEYKDESFKVEGLLIIFIYIGLLYNSILWYCYAPVHAFVIGWIWKYRSKLLNNILGNKVVVHFAKYSMFIYLSHIIIIRAIKQSWWVDAIVSLMFGAVLCIIYEHAIGKIIKSNK